MPFEMGSTGRSMTDEISRDDRTTAYGLARYAEEYYAAAHTADEVLGERDGYEIFAPMPVMYLYAHAIELSLKSFLRKEGWSLKRVEALSHDLVKALEKAEEHGLAEAVSLTPNHRGTIKLLVEEKWWSRFKYIQKGPIELPVAGPLVDVAHAMVWGVCNHVGVRLPDDSPLFRHLRACMEE